MARSNPFNFGWQSFLMWVSLTVIGCAFGWFLGMDVYVPRYKFGALSEIGSALIQLSLIGGVAAIFQWFVLRSIIPHAWAWPVLTVAAWITGSFGSELYPEVVTSNELVFFSLVAAWAGALQWFVLRQRFTGGVWWISLSAVGGGAGWVIGWTLADEISSRMVGRGVLAGIGYGLGLGIATGLALALFLKARKDPTPAGKVNAV